MKSPNPQNDEDGYGSWLNACCGTDRKGYRPSVYQEILKPQNKPSNK